MASEMRRDGGLSLLQSERECQHEQIDRSYKLIQMTTKSEPDGSGQINFGNAFKFELERPAKILKNLHFVELGSQNLDTLKKTKEGLGWTFMIDSYIYVKDKLRRVLVFGKKS